MGILGQTLAGFVSGAANTGADLMKDQIKTERAAAIQTERDKAQAIKEQSLAEFRINKEHSLKGSGMVDSFGAEFTNEELAKHQYNPETEEAPMSKKEYDRLQEIDKNTLLDGNESTTGIIRDAIEGNKVTNLIDSERQAEAKKFMESDEAKKMSPEERGKRMTEILGKDEDVRKSWEGSTGKVDRIKDIEARQKAEEKELERKAKAEEKALDREEKRVIELEKIEARARESKDRNEVLKYIADLRNGKDTEGKPLTVDKALDRGTALMKAGQDKEGNIINPDMYELGKNYIDWAAGKTEGVKVKPKTTPEATDFIFGGQPAAAATPAKAAAPAGKKEVTAKRPAGFDTYDEKRGLWVSKDGKRGWKP